MSCFPCFQRQKSKDHNAQNHHADGNGKKPRPGGDPNSSSDENFDLSNINSQNFTFRELATATKNFRQECLLGEGGFGRVYRGTLKSGQVVAVKQLDRNGTQGNKEFLMEVSMLSHLKHDNLLNLLGYCADGDQRLLVFEYMSGGSLENNLLDIGSDQKHLDWSTRVKIAYGAAQGLEFLHETADPPIIYRELKSSNILLDESFNSKLSDFGLAKFGSGGDKCNVPSRMMGTYGYSAPECTSNGEVTVKSDVYSFGVVLLELITGRRAMDTSKPIDEQNLVSWAQPKFRDPKSFPDMADPLLAGRFPEKALNQAVAVAAMCLQEESSVRPLMSDVVATLSFLLMIPDDPLPAPAPAPVPNPTPAPAEQAGGNDSDNGQSSDDGKGNSDRADSESSYSESSESDKEKDLEGKSLLDSSKSHVSVASSSKRKKRRSSRRLSHKESIATSSDLANTQTNSLSEDGSFSSSYTSHGSSASSGFSISKSGPNYDKSLSRARSKASSRTKSMKGSRVSSRRNKSKESDMPEDSVHSSGSSGSGEEEEDEEEDAEYHS